MENTHKIIALAYNPVTKKAPCAKAQELLSAAQAHFNYPTGHWVTRKQAEQLGGFAEDCAGVETTHLQKNGKERRRTANNSTALISGVSKAMEGVVITFKVRGISKITKKPTLFRVAIEYFNVAQCYGVRIPLPELHAE